ncbi:uncharacterized protein LOC117111400 [Anneissia japonica]|uniref:uncharacterized protein LOC117111400 n=1 Tax=Anneissia japonica TaxID=1529436 RepID=UPI00142566AA|nr:uncharacterized protein LOC117111400 [Anneissia japonica]XP_033110199.1 uncharacterized protein LOC117111400 [Anneissia japonica]
MVTRGIHVEILESMDSSCFINALRRFFAIRGPVKQIRSDCGTNFVGACNELGHQLVDKDCVKRYLLGRGCEWIFNPPHASHMGGAWERLIGMARRILDSVLREVKPSRLTHEVLVTLMAEVSAILNSRPLLPDSDDPELPINLSPNMLLTMKASQITAPEGPFNQNDLLRNQWRRVQHLSNMFWLKWRKHYLPLLQARRKWQTPMKDLQKDDVVLVRDSASSRCSWPFGRILHVEPSADGRVRKVSIEMADAKRVLRPISELILLVPAKRI